MSIPLKRLESRFIFSLNRFYKVIEEAIKDSPDPQTLTRRLYIIARSPEYLAWCDDLALRITTQVYEGVSATWRKAALKAGRGNEFYSAILEELKTPRGGVFFQNVRQNADLIKTFPPDVSKDLTDYIAREGLKGRRSGDILTDLKEQFPHTAKSRLRLIARTEVSKTESALTQARAVSLGLNWYIWHTSEDSRVRSAHRHMADLIINWNDPPNPEQLFPDDRKPYGSYHAGSTFQCRCYASPIVDIDFVNFPARVHLAGTVKRMTRADFEKIM